VNTSLVKCSLAILHSTECSFKEKTMLIKRILFVAILLLCQLLSASPAYPCSRGSTWMPRFNVPDRVAPDLIGEVVPYIATITQPSNKPTGTSCSDIGDFSVFLEPGRLQLDESETAYVLVDVIEIYDSNSQRKSIEYAAHFLRENKFRLSPLDLISITGTPSSPDFDYLVSLTVVSKNGRYSKPSRAFRYYYDSSSREHVIRYHDEHRDDDLHKSIIQMAGTIESKIHSGRLALGGKPSHNRYDTIEPDNVERISVVGEEVGMLKSQLDVQVGEFLQTKGLDINFQYLYPEYYEFSNLVDRFLLAVLLFKSRFERPEFYDNEKPFRFENVLFKNNAHDEFSLLMKKSSQQLK